LLGDAKSSLGNAKSFLGDAESSLGDAERLLGYAGDSAVMAQLQMVPGPAAGEGCSTSGGCASCPYMKMNTLTSLLRVCELVGTPQGEVTLRSYEPEKYSDDLGGQTVAERGVVSITHMRYFTKHGALSERLVADIASR
jgi:quinolinate synthase